MFNISNIYDRFIFIGLLFLKLSLYFTNLLIKKYYLRFLETLLSNLHSQ